MGREFLSFRREPESSYFNEFWTPAFAGVTLLGAFYEILNLCKIEKPLPHPLDEELIERGSYWGYQTDRNGKCVFTTGPLIASAACLFCCSLCFFSRSFPINRGSLF
jgi:hypothetical protein